jgi:hypothetical protein
VGVTPDKLVTCSPCAVVFINEPATANAGQTISDSQENPTGGAVTAELVDSNGNLVSTSGTPITVALSGGTSGASLGGTLTQYTQNGVATFNNLSVNDPGYNYMLTASSSGLTSGTSSAFNVYNFGSATQCPAGQNCTGTATDSGTQGEQTNQQLSVTAYADSSSGLLTSALDRGTSYFVSQAGCDGYTPIAADYDVFYMTDSARAKSLTDTVTLEVPSLAALDQLIAEQQYCFYAPYSFQAKTTTTGTTTTLADQTTLPDGSHGYIGLLPDCATGATPATITNPCVASRGGQEIGTVSLGEVLGTVAITIDIPAGETQDPGGMH